MSIYCCNVHDYNFEFARFQCVKNKALSKRFPKIAALFPSLPPEQDFMPCLRLGAGRFQFLAFNGNKHFYCHQHQIKLKTYESRLQNYEKIFMTPNNY